MDFPILTPPPALKGGVIQPWASIDLTRFARQLANWTEDDARSAKEKLLGADYYSTMNDCRREVDEVLRLEDAIAAVKLVRRRVCCTPYSARTAALTRWMVANVTNLEIAAQLLRPRGAARQRTQFQAEQLTARRSADRAGAFLHTGDQ